MTDIVEVIRTRKSVRTFDGNQLSPQHAEDLRAFIDTIRNPYGIPVEFVWLDMQEHGLSTPVINGETVYLAAKVAKQRHCEEAFGYSFEKMVLHAWSLGIGTTWIGGSMDRKLFEDAARTGADEYMLAVTPLGYPSDEHAEVDIKLRSLVKGDERMPASDLFFEGDFSTPLADAGALELLESVRWAPSAANRQPWRVVKDGNVYHFFEKRFEENHGEEWDVHKVDMGIALCHLMSVTGGNLTIADPGIEAAEGTEYIATVTL